MPAAMQTQERAQQPERPLLHEWLFDVNVELDAPPHLGPMGNGHRQIFPIRGGSISVPRLQGEMLPGGSDWVLGRQDGSLLLGIRATAKTHHGHLIGVLGRGDSYTSARGTRRMQKGKPIAGTDAIRKFWKEKFDAGLTGANLKTLEVYIGSDGETATEVGQYKLVAGYKPADEGKYVVIWKHTQEGWKLHRNILTTHHPGE